MSTRHAYGWGIPTALAATGLLLAAPFAGAAIKSTSMPRRALVATEPVPSRERIQDTPLMRIVVQRAGATVSISAGPTDKVQDTRTIALRPGDYSPLRRTIEQSRDLAEKRFGKAPTVVLQPHDDLPYDGLFEIASQLSTEPATDKNVDSVVFLSPARTDEAK